SLSQRSVDGGAEIETDWRKAALGCTRQNPQLARTGQVHAALRRRFAAGAARRARPRAARSEKAPADGPEPARPDRRPCESGGCFEPGTAFGLRSRTRS